MELFMTGRELVKKTLRFEEVERLPRTLCMTPNIWMFREDELAQFYRRFPDDTTFTTKLRYGQSPYFRGTPNRKGSFTDEFGCEWHTFVDGVCGEVKKGPLQSMADLDAYKLPWELLDGADFSGQNEAYKSTDKYIIAGSLTRPFERMQFLCGTEELYTYIAEENPMFFKLLEMLHEFNVRELKMVAAQAVDGVSFMDDWGSQTSLLISPLTWRKYFKPMYREYCEIIHAAGKDVFFHSDGRIELIYGDLVEIGVNAINSQLWCMDMEALGDKYAGKIAFWGGVDRQYALPRGTEEDVRKNVRRMGKALLKKGHTGLFAEMSWEGSTPLANALAAFDEFEKI